MAIFKRKGHKADATPPPRVVMASAVPLAGPGVRRVSLSRNTQTTEQWQNDAWYFYDSLGELRAPVNWIANAISKADLFAAEIDSETGLVSGPTDNAQAQAAAAACLGGEGRRSQLQYILAVCWQVPGEAFVIIRPTGPGRPDRWLVLSGQKVKPKAGQWTYQDPETLEWLGVDATKDLMIRIWSPHPNDQSKADTAVRAALPVMREIEKASMSLAATMDSRLSTAGVHAVPQEMDFPGVGPGELAQHVTEIYVENAAASLSNPGTAEARVPVVFAMPGEMIEQFVAGRIFPDATMDQTVVELRTADLSRLAHALDMPNETAEGSTSGMNHWGAWQVEESTYKIFIEPLLDRVGDAFTEIWFRSALASMGVADPERYTLAWDTTGIVARPDATADLDHLYDLGLISDDYRREASGVPDSAIPDDEESRRRFIERVVIGAPTLLGDPTVAQLLGLPEIAPAAVGVDPVALEGADAVREQAEAVANALPAAPDDTQPVLDDVPDGLTAAAELIVFDALSRAGGRLLTREYRGQFAGTPKHELHTVIPRGDMTALLADSFLWADRVADTFGVNRENFALALNGYVQGRLRQGLPHDPKIMRLALVAML